MLLHVFFSKDDSGMSEYEKKREANIKLLKQKQIELGLIQAQSTQKQLKQGWSYISFYSLLRLS